MQPNKPAALVVLVVDDEPFLRFNICDYLEDAGMTVLEATSADDALKILRSKPQISAIITDVQMPGTMDGIELARLVRDRWPRKVIIISSGHAAPSTQTLPKKVLVLA